MNRPSTAKEALLTEAFGEMASLIERLETLALELDASRQALVLSHGEHINVVAIFRIQMTAGHRIRQGANGQAHRTER